MVYKCCCALCIDVNSHFLEANHPVTSIVTGILVTSSRSDAMNTISFFPVVLGVIVTKLFSTNTSSPSVVVLKKTNKSFSGSVKCSLKSIVVGFPAGILKVLLAPFHAGALLPFLCILYESSFSTSLAPSSTSANSSIVLESAVISHVSSQISVNFPF